MLVPTGYRSTDSSRAVPVFPTATLSRRRFIAPGNHYILILSSYTEHDWLGHIIGAALEVEWLCTPI
jgi:hypothetical protein